MPRARTLTAAALGAALLLGGCGGDADSPDPDPTTSGSGSPSTSVSASAGDSPTATPTASDSASASASGDAAPATGVELELDSSAINAPAGWTEADTFSASQRGATDAATQGVLSIYDQVTPTGDSSTPDRSWQALQTTLTGDQSAERAPDVELDGVPAMHAVITSSTLGGQVDHRYAVRRDGRDVVIDLTISPQDYAGSTEEAFLASVLASFRWLS